MKKISPIAYFLFTVGVIFVAFQFLLQMSPGIMVTYLMRDFAIDAVQVGFIGAGFFYSYIILQIPSGILADRIGPQRLLSIALLIVSFCCFAFAFAPDLNTAIISRVLMGIFAAPAFVCTLAIAANWFPRKNFALLTGLTELFAMLGGAVNSLFLSYSVETFGWQHSMIGCGIFGLILTLFCFLVVRRSWQSHPRHDFKAQSKPLLAPLLRVFKNSQVWIAGIFGGAVYSIVVVFGGLWSVPFLSQAYQIDTSRAGNINAIFFIGVAFGAPLIGWLSDHWRQRKPLMLIGTLISLALLIMIIYFPPDIAWIRLWLFLLGFSVGVFLLGYALAKDHADIETYGAAIGLANMLYGVMGAPFLQPFIGWLLMRHSGGATVNGVAHYSLADYQAAFWPLILVLGIALASLLLIREAVDSETESA